MDGSNDYSIPDELNSSTINPAKMAILRETSSFGAMANSKLHSDGGIVFYALRDSLGKPLIRSFNFP